MNISKLLPRGVAGEGLEKVWNDITVWNFILKLYKIKQRALFGVSKSTLSKMTGCQNELIINFWQPTILNKVYFDYWKCYQYFYFIKTFEFKYYITKNSNGKFSKYVQYSKNELQYLQICLKPISSVHYLKSVDKRKLMLQLSRVEDGQISQSHIKW